MKVYQFSEMMETRGPWAMMLSDLLEANVIHTGEWQAMNTTGSPAHRTHELEDVSLVWDRLPVTNLHKLVPDIDEAWVTEHFRERVSGQPLNPAPSHVRWPYAVRGNAMHTDAAARFDHTYPERFWPKHVATGTGGVGNGPDWATMEGIRFAYGDLGDLVNLFVRSPLTRQAYLPVWFPEDTGAVDGQRVPCTLGYHFMQRGGRLTCRYYIRSCDAYRHLSNDVYFAAALTNWICDEVYGRTMDSETPVRFRPGGLVMHISSLHLFTSDEGKIKARLEAL
ncbi:MAG: hypothetical protein ABW022_11260 [Actinoplanes sp.]